MFRVDGSLNHLEYLQLEWKYFPSACMAPGLQANIHQLLFSFSWVQASSLTAFCKLEIELYSDVLTFSMQLDNVCIFSVWGQRRLACVVCFFFFHRWFPLNLFKNFFLFGVKLESQIGTLNCRKRNMCHFVRQMNSKPLWNRKFRNWDNFSILYLGKLCGITEIAYWT